MKAESRPEHEATTEERPSVRQRMDDTVSGFHGGPAVENPPARTGDTGPIPAAGQSHKSRNNEAHESQRQSL